MGTPELAFQTDKDGMTPLHWAADRGVVDVARILVEMAGDSSVAVGRMNAQDESGDTALHYAVLTENLEIGELLIKRNADPSIENKEGDTPLALADNEEWRTLFESAEKD